MLIVGCGYVGSELARQLIRAGHEVWGVRRSVDALPDGVHRLKWDVTADPDEAPPLPDVDALVYAVSPGGYTEAQYRAAYVQGPTNVLAALRTQENGPLPPLGVFVGSTAVYGYTDGRDVDESTPSKPLNFAGEAVLDGEAVFRRSLENTVAVRLGGIYGPGRTRLLERVASGKARIPATPRWSNRIHRDDCAGVIAHLLARHEAGESLEDVYVGVDASPTRYGDVIRWLAGELDAPTPAPADPDATRSRKRPRTNKRCLNRAITASGYEYAYPSFRDGYAEMIARGDWRSRAGGAR